jgi:hypothetical protein
MPSVKLPGGKGWTVLAQPDAAPAHMTSELTGERIDLDEMLRRIGLRTSDFNGAPSHKPKVVKDTAHCKHGHDWSEYVYVIPGTTTRICRKCKDDSRLRAQASAKASKARNRSLAAPLRTRKAA